MRFLNGIADKQATRGLEIGKRERRLEAQWSENEKADEFADKMLQRQFRGFQNYQARAARHNLVEWKSAFENWEVARD